VKEALADRFGWPYSVCRPAAALGSEPETATVAMLLLHPKEGRIDVAPMPAEGHGFTSYALDAA
jgi:isopenicillin-N N-acyltransferase like protein